MKKSFRKVSALVLAFLMVLAVLPAMGKAQNVKADEKTYHAFIGIGAESEGNSWNMCYEGPKKGALEGATVEEADMKIGDTATISITLPDKASKVWWMAPCLVMDEAGMNVDVVVTSLKIDGVEIAIDKTQYDKAAWYEGTGDYTGDECVRVAGGYNEWGAKGIEIPVGAQKIEYTLKLNAVYSADSYYAFVAIGGDSAKENASWDYNYAGPASTNTEGVVAKDGAVKVGESVTISVTFPDTFKHAYYTAPCILIPGATDKTKVDATVTSVKIDGVEVACDLTQATDSAWAEGTGSYGKECYRIAGGYNEWAAKCIAAPENFKTIEYTFTLNSVELDPVEKEVVDFTGALDLHIAFGGDKDASGDWGYGYTTGFSEDPVPVEEVIKVGETKTVSLTFSKNVPHAYYFAPYLSSEENIEGLVVDVEVTCKINGVEVTLDKEGKKVCWNEGTGDFAATNAVRLMGGHNDWAADVTYVTIPEEGIKTLEYTVTLKSAQIEKEVEQEFDKTLLEKEYNGYLIFQCPDTWVYRDDWTNESSGLLAYKDDPTKDNFTHVTWNEGATDEDKNLGGTCTDIVITGNGTYTVKIEGFKAGLADSTAWNMLYASLDIPYDCIERGGVTITDAVLLIDGKKQNISALITKGDKVDSKNHPEVNGTYTVVQFINVYNSENPNAKDSAAIPQKSIEIQFTIAGLAKDAAPVAVEPTPTEAPAAEPTQAPAENTPVPTEAVDVAPANQSSNTPIIIVIVVCAVVLVAAVVGIVVAKKKKN